MTNPDGPKFPSDPHEAFRMQNDVIGVRLWGPPKQPTFSIGKSDIWDRRWFEERQPSVAIQKIKELAIADGLSGIVRDPNNTIYDLYGKYDFPCPKPGAQLILGTPFATDARYKPDSDGSALITITDGYKRLSINLWVALMRSLIMMEFTCEGLEPDDLWVSVYRHRDTILPGQPVDPTIGGGESPDDFEQLPLPQSFQSDDCWGISQRFLPENTFPDGFHFAVTATSIGIEPEITCVDNKRNLGTPLWAEQEGRLSHGVIKRYTPLNQALGSSASATFHQIPEKFIIMTAVATTQDSCNDFESAVKTINEIKGIGIKGLQIEQSSALQKGQRRELAQAKVDENSRISTPKFVYPSLRKKGGYYGDIPLCSVDSTKFCFQDSALWHADFHLNEIRAEGMLTLGQFEELMPYCEMIHTLLTGAQENARDVYGLSGAMYPLVHFPLRTKGIAHTNLTWEQDIGLNGLICKPLWLYYRYTGDQDFLKNLAYPVLRECARFCHAYLTECDDGNLHVIPTVSPEHWGLTANFERNRDCTSAITLIRYLLNSSAKAARILDQDNNEAKSWESSAKKLVPYPIYMTDSGPIWVDVADAPPIEYNIPVPLTPVFWGDDVGLDSLPETLDIAKRTLNHINVWVPHRGYLNSCIRPRLGIWDQDSHISTENLLLSYQSIHIFPAVPPEGEIVMENFAAEGGFRISAVRSTDGDIHDVRIKSSLGGVCHITNPWGEKSISIINNGVRFPHRESIEHIISFDTEIGEIYELAT